MEDEQNKQTFSMLNKFMQNRAFVAALGPENKVDIFSFLLFGKYIDEKTAQNTGNTFTG